MRFCFFQIKKCGYFVQHLNADGCQTLSMDDTELINQILNGNMHAFTFLVNRYQKLVVHITGRLVQRRDELEDVCQEVFLKVYQNLRLYRKECKLSTWIATIAYNTSINYLRKFKKGGEVNTEDLVAFEKLADFKPDDYEKADLHRYIREQIELLPVQYLSLIHISEPT